MHKDTNLHKYLRSTRIIAITQQIIKLCVSLSRNIYRSVFYACLSVSVTVTFTALKNFMNNLSVCGKLFESFLQK